MKKKYLFPIIIISITVFINAFIIMHSCFNASLSSSSSGRLVNILKTIINVFIKDGINDNNIGTFTHVIRKLIGHFSLFVISGFFTSLSFYFIKNIKHVYYYLSTLTFGFLLATMTEFIQRYVPGRSGEFIDSMIDFGGYITGFLLLVIILLIKSLARGRKNKKEFRVKNIS